MKFRISLFLFLILLVANGFLFLNRERFAYTAQVAYKDAYPQRVGIPVRDIIAGPAGRLTFHLRNDTAPSVVWQITVNGRQSTVTASDPYLALIPGLHYYSITSPLLKDSITASVEYIAAAEGKQAFTAVYRTNARLKEPHANAFSSFNDPVSPLQEKKLLSLLTDSIRVTNSLTAQEKTTAISKWLHRKIYRSRGTPLPEVEQMNPYDAYIAASGGEKIWCGIYARIFHLFAAHAGVESRIVELTQAMPGITGAVHEANEYYAPETGKWIAVDVMFNAICFKNGAGEMLNIAQVKNAAAADSSISMDRFSGDSMVRVPLSAQERFFFDLYSPDKELHFYRHNTKDFNGTAVKRLRNYVSRRSWYEIYSDSSVADNRNFYLKQGLLILLIAAAVFTILLYLLPANKIRHDRI